MAALTKAGAFRKGSKWSTAKVDVPELGDPKDAMVTYVRKLPSRVLIDHDKLFNETEGKGSERHVIERMAHICVLGMCNKNGEVLFDESDIDRLIDDWPFEVLLRVAAKISDFNHLNEDPETTVKNLPESRPKSSPTGSPKK